MYRPVLLLMSFLCFFGASMSAQTGFLPDAIDEWQSRFQDLARQSAPKASKTTALKQRVIGIATYTPTGAGVFYRYDTTGFRYSGNRGMLNDYNTPQLIGGSTDGVTGGSYIRFDTMVYERYHVPPQPAYRDIAAYSSTDRLVSVIRQYYSNGAFFDSLKAEYTYNTGDTIESSRHYRMETGQWQMNRKASFVYSGGRLTSDTIFLDQGSGIAPAFVTEYQYTGQGWLQDALMRHWNGGAWELYLKDTAGYTPAGHLNYMRRDNYVMGSWAQTHRREFHINAAGLPDTISQYNQSGGNWQLYAVNAITYNAEGNPEVRTVYAGNNLQGSVYYYYETYEDLAVNDAGGVLFTMAPNPARDQIRLSAGGFTGQLTVDIISLQGTLLSRAFWTGGTEMVLQTSGLVSGTYVLQISRQGRPVYRQRFTRL